MPNRNQQEERGKLVTKLNFLHEDEKLSWWLNHQSGCKMKAPNKDGELEFNWYHFTKQNIWMCRVYDYEQAKIGEGFLREVLYFTEKENLTQIYKQWSVL